MLRLVLILGNVREVGHLPTFLELTDTREVIFTFKNHCQGPRVPLYKLLLQLITDVCGNLISVGRKPTF